jgi:hypothetical protein
MKQFFTLAFALLLSTVLFAQAYPTGTRTITFVDAARGNRSVDVEFHYPATTAGSNTALANDSFNFIVFGHGFQMGASAYLPYSDSLAKNGYIVAYPNTESSLSPSHPNFAQDLIFVYNQIILANNNSSSPLYHKVRIRGAIGGHSMGAGCTVLSASYGNPATCYFTFAAANTNPSSIAAAPAMTKPYLAFAGSYDCIAPYASNQLPMYDSSGSACKVLVNINGASHCQFGAGNFQCNFGEGVSFCANPPTSRSSQINTTLRYMYPFFDYYLRGNCAAWTTFDNVYNADATNSKKRNCTNTVPSNAAINGATAFCAGGSSTLTAAPAGFQYNWSNGSTANILNVTSGGTYSVTVGNGVCSITAAPLTVNAINTVLPIITGDTIACNSTTLIASATGATNYNWSNAAATASNTITGSGSYTVTADFGSGCTTTATTSVSIDTVSATINGPTTICSGLSATLTVSGGASYAWSNGLGSGTSVTVSPSQPTTYTVTATSSGGGCTATPTQTVSVQSTPTAMVSGPTSVCHGNTIALTANGGNSYNWSNGLGSNSTINVSPDSNTTYTVTATIGAGCTATADYTVTVLQATSAQVAELICSGSVYSFNGTALTVAGTYTDTIQNAAGCDSIITLILSVDTIPHVVITQVGTQQLSAGTGYVSYQWLENGQVIPNETSPFFYPTHDGSYSVIVTNRQQCADTAAAFSFVIGGINEQEIENIRLYPNPVSNELYIRATEQLGAIVITDIMGRVVISTKAEANTAAIDMSKLSAGLYMVQLTASDNAIQTKMIRKQ